MSKRIVFATGIFPPDIGGPAIYVSKLGKELVKRGFEVDMVTFSDKMLPDDYGFPVARISRKYPKGIRHLLFFLKLLSISKNKDVIYSQNQISAGLPSLIISRLLRKKLVSKVVGDAAWENYANRSKKPDSLDVFQNKKYGFFVELLKKIRSFTVKNSDEIIVPSYYLRDIVCSWGISKEKISVIYNSLDFFQEPDFSRENAKQKINIHGDIILSVGRLCSWKGFETLIDIMPDLLKQNPDFRLVIVGEGSEKKNLENKIKQLKIKDKVRLTGRINHQDISLYFKAADMFVLNSEYEGLSHVALEAMQLNVPMILSDSGGNSELVEDNFNGLLMEYNNKKQIKESIIKLYNDKNLQQTFITNSKKKLKQFSWDNLVKRTIDIILNQD